MVTRLMQQREDDPVAADRGVETEAAVHPHQPHRAAHNRLGVDRAAFLVVLEFKAGKGFSEIRKNKFKQSPSLADRSTIPELLG